MNLALPIVCLSEPGVAPKTKLSDTVEYTLWDKWEVRESEAETLKVFFFFFFFFFCGVLGSGVAPVAVGA